MTQSLLKVLLGVEERLARPTEAADWNLRTLSLWKLPSLFLSLQYPPHPALGIRPQIWQLGAKE